MFTVKYVSPQGEENLSECHSVILDRTEHDGSKRVLVFNEIPTLAKDNNSGVFCSSNCDSTDDIHGGIVYVMNRFGATVATYRL